MTAGELVRRLYEAYQDRDWDIAQRCLHPDAVVEMPATAERLAGRMQVIEFQSQYPEPWGDLAVRRVVDGGESAAAEIEVIAPDGTVFRMAAFWQLSEGLLRSATEYWVDPGGEPPPGRAAYPAGA